VKATFISLVGSTIILSLSAVAQTTYQAPPYQVPVYQAPVYQTPQQQIPTYQNPTTSDDYAPSPPHMIEACVQELASLPTLKEPGKKNALSALYEGMERSKNNREKPGPECSKLNKRGKMDAALIHSQRVTDRLSKQVEEERKIKDAEQKRIKEEIKPALQRSFENWKNCLELTSLEMARSSESAEIALEAVFGICGPEEKDMEKLWSKSEGRSMSDAIEGAKKKLRPHYIGMIVSARLKNR
jgi:hypothetical protein